MLKPIIRIFLFAAICFCHGGGAVAETFDRRWSETKAILKDSGVDIRLQAISTIEMYLPRAGVSVSRGGGKLVARSVFDLGRMIGFDGLSISVRFEQNLGHSLNGIGGSLFPFNTSLAFPGEGRQAGDLTEVYIAQRSGNFSFSIGKFDMVSRATLIPLQGGGTLGGFRHLGLAAPATGVTPPYLFGAMATYSTPWASFALMGYDPDSAVRRDPTQGLFRNGVTLLASATVPVTVSGLLGYHGLKLVSGSSRGTDLSQISQALQPGFNGAIPRKAGVWYAAYSFQQNLWQDASDPRRAWGVFGQISMSDSNPTFIGNSFFFGIGGTSPLSDRSGDNFGIGYFRYNLSKDLIAQLKPSLNISGESGFEFYYNAQLNENIRTTFSAQWVRPVLSTSPSAFVIGLRTQLEF